MAVQQRLFGDRLPDGLVYVPDFLTREDEASLLRAIAELPMAEARYKAFTARRRIASFGTGYDFDRQDVTPAPPLPAFLLPLRDRAAALAHVPSDRFSHALVSEYRPGTPLGWHRDAPAFGVIVGVSLAAACRLRFRPFPHVPRSRAGFELLLEPRSAYVLRDDARWRWQHAVPPTTAHRFSITFRTLREAACDTAPRTAGSPARRRRSAPAAAPRR